MRDKMYDGGRNSVASRRSALCRVQSYATLPNPVRARESTTPASSANRADVFVVATTVVATTKTSARVARNLHDTRCVSGLGYSSTHRPRAAALPRVR